MHDVRIRLGATRRRKVRGQGLLRAELSLLSFYYYFGVESRDGGPLYF